MRLIDADTLKANVPNTNVDIFENCRNCSTLMDWEVKELIDKQPTVDAVHVTRCAQCKYGSKCLIDMVQCKVYGVLHSADWFCAGGERRE